MATQAAVRITKEFDFEMAHALDFHKGKCKNIHGHSYKLSVTIKGTPEPEDKKSSISGMIMDFKDLGAMVKELIVEPLDHALMLSKTSPYLSGNVKEENYKLVLTDFQPTAENMVVDFAAKIKSKLPSHVQLIRLMLRETATGYAEWLAEDN